MRVAVVGCGGIGTYAGAVVSQLESTTVVYCARAPVDEIVADTSRERFRGYGEIVTSPEQAGEVDLVILATKAHDTSSTAPWLTALCGESTRVLVLQNGVEQEDRVQPLAPGRAIVPAVVWYGAQRSAPGRVRLTLPGDVTVPDTEAGRWVVESLNSPRLPFKTSPHFECERWTKFVHNVASNSLTTILDVPVNRLPRIGEARILLEQLVEECREVAAAAGVVLPATLAASVCRKFASFDDGVRSSTQVDREAGRPFEYDAIIGAVVRLGNRFGIRTDTARVLLRLLRAMSEDLESRQADRAR